MKPSDFSEKLLVVSGKGGVGKTALSSALAVRSAKQTTTILLTMNAAQDVHPFFEVPFRYDPVELGPNLFGANLEPLAAIREYVRRKVPFSAFYDAFLKSRMFRDFADAAPGFEELMSLGKIYDLATSSKFGRIIVDAPASGHLKTLLDVPGATLKAVQVGPLNHNARRIQDLLLNPEQTRVVLATLPEEMAIREALELREYCRERRIQVGPMLVNQHVAQRFDVAELDQLNVLLTRAAADSGLAWGARAALEEASLAAVQSASLQQLDGIETRLVPRLASHEPAALIEAIATSIGSAAVSTGRGDHHD